MGWSCAPLFRSFRQNRVFCYIYLGISHFLCCGSASCHLISKASSLGFVLWLFICMNYIPVVLQQLIHATPSNHPLLFFFCLQPGISIHISVGISAKKPPHQAGLNHVRSWHNLEAFNFLWTGAGNNFGNKSHGFWLAIQKCRGWKCLCVVANFRQQSL